MITILLACASAPQETAQPADSRIAADDSVEHTGGDSDDTLDTQDTGSTEPQVTVHGDVVCADCADAVMLLVTGEQGRQVTRSLAGAGAFEVQVPQALGAVSFAAWSDADGDRLQDAGEANGAVFEPIALGDGLSGVTVAIGESVWDGSLAHWGVEQDDGFWVIPGSLMVRVGADVTADQVDQVAQDAGATVVDFIDEVDLAWLTLDTDGLDAAAALAQLEAAEASLGAADGVRMTLRDRPLPDGVRGRTHADDDYVIHPASDDLGIAHRAANVDGAKDVYDDCVHHLDAADYTRTVKIAVVDNDLNGLLGSTEVPTAWAAHRETITKHHGFSGSTGHHGSAVSSVIWGQNNTSGVNGFLEGFEGTGPRGSYSVAATITPWNIGHGGNLTVATALYGLYKAITYDHAQVINASLGFHKDQMPLAEWHQHTLDLRKELSRSSGTVFVFAAPNKLWDIDVVHDWSTFGSSAANVVAVSGVRGDQGYGGASDTTDAITLSGEVRAGFWFRDVVYAADGTHTLGTPSLKWDDGNSFVAPQVSAAVGLILAFDPTRTPGAIKALLRQTGDPNDAALERGRRTLNLQRLAVNLLAKDIDASAEYLMKISVSPPDSSSCGPAGLLTSHRCIPIQADGNGIAGAPDVSGNTYTLTAAKFGSAAGAAFDVSISGSGLSPIGIQPHQTRYQGTVSRPEGYAPEDLRVTGRYTGEPTSGWCSYAGDFEAVLLRVQVPDDE